MLSAPSCSDMLCICSRIVHALYNRLGRAGNGLAWLGVELYPPKRSALHGLLNRLGVHSTFRLSMALFILYARGEPIRNKQVQIACQVCLSLFPILRVDQCHSWHDACMGKHYANYSLFHDIVIGLANQFALSI